MNLKHGLKGSRVAEYRAWERMRARCNNPNHPDFANYGGRGISVCSRWNDFAAFYADMGDRPDGMSLDRVDCDKPYSPDNCRWATARTQGQNRRKVTWIEHEGRRLTLPELSEATSIKYTTLRKRYISGCSYRDLIRPVG